MTIDILNDDALLYVFDFYVAQASEVEAWHVLVHICRRWRNLVFGSPRRLNLQIACTVQTKVRNLGVWPALPIVVSGRYSPKKADPKEIIAALKHNDCVCQIKLYFDLCNTEDIVASLEKPFPILTDLELHATVPSPEFNFDPPKFLGGSTHLRSLTLRGTSIPDFLKLPLYTPNLTILHMYGIPDSDFCPPEELVNCLSALPRLKQLHLQVNFGRSHPDWENRRLPLTSTVLPSLTLLRVCGATENLEDFMARIDAPLLDHLYIQFPPSISNVIAFNAPYLLRFISRIPKLQAPDEAYIGFDPGESKIWIDFICSRQISCVLRLGVSSPFRPKGQFPGLARLCRLPLFPLRPLEHLFIGDLFISKDHFPILHQCWQNYTQNTHWLEILQPFAAVRNLYLTKEFGLHIAHAFQELVGERAMEVLPALKNVFIDELQPSGPVHEIMEQFIATRQLAGHPIIISHYEAKNRPAWTLTNDPYYRTRLNRHWQVPL